MRRRPDTGVPHACPFIDSALEYIKRHNNDLHADIVDDIESAREIAESLRKAAEDALTDVARLEDEIKWLTRELDEAKRDRDYAMKDAERLEYKVAEMEQNARSA